MSLVRGAWTFATGLTLGGCGAFQQAEGQTGGDPMGSSTTGSGDTASASKGEGTDATDAVDGSDTLAATQGGTIDDDDGAAVDTGSTSNAGGSSSDGAAGYAGNYDGTLSVTCPDQTLVTGTAQLTVDAVGTVSGTVMSGFGLSAFNGTVDDAGALTGTADVVIDVCSFAGMIDDTGSGSGTIGCAATGCVGPFDLTQV